MVQTFRSDEDEDAGNNDAEGAEKRPPAPKRAVWCAAERIKDRHGHPCEAGDKHHGADDHAVNIHGHTLRLKNARIALRIANTACQMPAGAADGFGSGAGAGDGRYGGAGLAGAAAEPVSSIASRRTARWPTCRCQSVPVRSLEAAA